MNELTALEWTTELEEYLKGIGEKCYGYQILHKKAQIKYDHQKNFLSIPSIILSTACGSLSIGSNQIFNEDENASIYIGAVSILVGIIQTLDSYFNWSKKAESHRNSSINYGKLFRFIRLQLTLPREQRIDLKNLLNMIRADYEKLQMDSDLIPYTIIEDFKKRYKEYKTQKPSEVNGLEAINIFSPYQEEEEVISLPKGGKGDISPISEEAINMIIKENKGVVSEIQSV